METKTLDKKYFARNEASWEIEITHSDKSFLYDSNNKKYVDFLMGWGVGILGWGNEELRKAIGNFSGPDYIYPHFLYKPWAELAELLAEITPGRLEKSFRSTGGSESIEAALQIAMSYTGRSKFMSVEGSYHGDTTGALSISASENRKNNKMLLPGCYKVDPPLNDKALKKIEARLKKKDIAAFIMEPVISNLGVLVPEEGFMPGLQELCRKYGTLLVIDEVATGFGRTGKLFASEHSGIEPDIMCLAKAITGGYAGLGATITTREIADAVEDKVSAYSTYGWHPVSVRAALAGIDYLMKNRESLMKNAESISALFRDRLGRMNFKEEPKLNIMGMLIGVDVGDEKYADSIEEECRQKGLIIGINQKYLLMFPSLTLDENTAAEGLDILQQCI